MPQHQSHASVPACIPEANSETVVETATTDRYQLMHVIGISEMHTDCMLCYENVYVVVVVLYPLCVCV
jgi:hypothetical protein